MAKRVTVSAIAERCDVAHTTVSRVLSGRKYQGWSVRPEVRERIERTAKQMNYRPNAAARAVQRGKFGSIALMMREGQSFLPMSMLHAASRHAHQHDNDLKIHVVKPDDLTDESRIPKLMREISVDGLLLTALPEQAMKVVTEATGVPRIIINSNHAEDCAYPDDIQGARLATQDMLKLGHRRIAFCTTKHPNSKYHHYSAIDRLNGYEQTMREAGLAPRMLHSKEPDAPSRHDPRFHEWRQDFQAPDRPTAAVCYSVESAIPIAEAALSCGLRIPEDLSITLLHPDRFVFTGVAMRVMHIPLDRCAATAVEMLMKRIAKPGESLPSQAIAYQPVEDGNLAPPPSKG